MAGARPLRVSAFGAWADVLAQEFEGIDLGDERLAKRCETMARTMALHPNRSIPKACGDWAGTQAAYRFLANERVSREALLEPHRERTIDRVEQAGEVLAIQDTTFLDFADHPGTEGLGPIGDGGGLGLAVHNTLAVSGESGEVLGLLGQHVWARAERVDKKESAWKRRRRERESQRWVASLQAVRTAGVPGIIHVADREADIYEFLSDLVAHGERFVVRAYQNRSLADGNGFLLQAAGELPAITETTVDVPARTSRKARKATLIVRAGSVRIRPPKELDRKGNELELRVVLAREEQGPQGVEPVEWLLLTSEPTDSPEACLKTLRLYGLRWKVEEFHKGLKTGCRVEERQLETRERLEAFLGLASVISVMLLRLRDAARGLGHSEPALNEVQQELLRDRYRDIPVKPTPRDWCRNVARLGGFLARKGDGEPGWGALWDGMWQLLLMEHGYHVAQRRLLALPKRGKCV